MTLPTRLVNLANRLGASFHAAVRAARNEWRLNGALDRCDPFGNPLTAGACEFCGAECRTHCDDCDNGIARPAPSSTPADHACHAGPWNAEKGAWCCPTCHEPPPPDWYVKWHEANVRPAPSTTTCKDCRSPWKPGHLCSEGRKR